MGNGVHGLSQQFPDQWGAGASPTAGMIPGRDRGDAATQTRRRKKYQGRFTTRDGRVRRWHHSGRGSPTLLGPLVPRPAIRGALRPAPMRFDIQTRGAATTPGRSGTAHTVVSGSWLARLETRGALQQAARTRWPRVRTSTTDNLQRVHDVQCWPAYSHIPVTRPLMDRGAHGRRTNRHAIATAGQHPRSCWRLRRAQPGRRISWSPTMSGSGFAESRLASSRAAGRCAVGRQEWGKGKLGSAIPLTPTARRWDHLPGLAAGRRIGAADRPRCRPSRPGAETRQGLLRHTDTQVVLMGQSIAGARPLVERMSEATAQICQSATRRFALPESPPTCAGCMYGPDCEPGHGRQPWPRHHGNRLCPPNGFG